MDHRNRISSRRIVLAVSLALAACSTTVDAQTARSGGASGGNAQLTQQLQQLASERTAMQAEHARMKKEIEELRQERDALKAAQKASGQRARVESEAAFARSARERDAAEAELARVEERTQELIEKFRETAQTLREVETDRATVKQAIAQQSRELEACVSTNMQLYTLNDEVLTRLGQQGFWSRAAQAEPFTKLKRVELENLIDEYRARADDQKLTPPGAQALAPTTQVPATR
jgi:chromosome segregation ATPase